MIYARHMYNSYKDSVDLKAVDKRLAYIDSLIKLKQTTWYNAFTHNAGNGNLWSISLIYPEFKYLMTELAKRYGEKGTDQLWMAPWQQVYEYLWLRDHTKVTVIQHGQNVTIKLVLPTIPTTFRYADISLHIKTRCKFTLNSPAMHTSDNGSAQHDLINVSLKLTGASNVKNLQNR